MLLQLQEGILYGPIQSRRLGLSQGINLMPGKYKLCSYNCVYCHYGWTAERTMDLRDYHEDLPSLEDVVKAVDAVLQSKTVFSYLTFSGNGESTIYPWFPELVEEVAKLRDHRRPHVKIALLSNSSGLALANVRESITKIDLPVFKLDAGTEKKWKLVNRPAKGVDFNEIIDALVAMDNITIQTALFGGVPSNTSEEDLEAYFEEITKIQPREVHIYSIDRPVPNTKITLVPPDKLKEIALQGQEKTGVAIKAFFEE